MKRNVIIVLGFLIVVSLGTVKAQDSYMSFSLGGSFPYGEFAERGDPGTDGFAGSSFTLAFDGNYFFGMLGIAGTLNFGMSYLDAEALKAARIVHLNEIYTQPVIPRDAAVDYITTQWSYVHLMVGPVFSVPLSVISFEVKAMGGVSFVMPPQQYLTITAGNDTWKSSASGQSIRLGYLTGAAVLIHPNPGYGIRLGVDYISTSGHYAMHYNLDQGFIANNEVAENEDIRIQVFHTTVGIFYNF
ncbi:MAG: hypothetical protein GXO83_01540 [Chlorobi bacterium]|nr:hypothetical protein [Chlorobiota bacterium]